MLLAPQAPPLFHDLVDAFAQTTQSVIDLGHACSDDDLALPTECPGWTVHDQISHVVGVESRLAGNKDPRIEVPDYEHVRNDIGRRVEFAVELRRGRTGDEVVTELEHVLAQRLSTLRSPGMTDASIIAGPFGQDQGATVLQLRTFDIWAHEQDIRSALGRPGNLDSAAAAVFVNAVLRSLPKVVAKGAGIEPGHGVVIEVTGPIAARVAVQVTLDEQGRLRGHAVSADEVADDEKTTIILSTEALTRRAAGRRSVSDTAYRVVGDEATARRVVEALVITP